MAGIKEENKQYWMCTVTKENWELCKQHNLWGVTHKNEKLLRKVAPEDILIFYIKGEKRIGGIYEAVSTILIHAEVDIWKNKYPFTIRISPIVIPKRLVPFKDLIDKLSFIERKSIWGTYLQRAMRAIPQSDYDHILIHCILHVD